MNRTRSYVFLKTLVPSASKGRLAVVLAICIGLVIGPYSMIGHVHAGDAARHATKHEAGLVLPHGDTGSDLLAHKDCCLVTLCSTSFILVPRSDLSVRVLVSAGDFALADEHTLRSLYGNGDPPIPRIDFSKSCYLVART